MNCCSTPYAQQFLDNIKPVYCSVEEYLQSVHSSYQIENVNDNGTSYLDRNQECVSANSDLYTPGPTYVELCRFCDQYYCTFDEFAEFVAFFFHKANGSISSQFIAKDSDPIVPIPRLLSANTAYSICYFCYLCLLEEKLPDILVSFRLNLTEMDQCFVESNIQMPLALEDLILQYANAEYECTKTTSHRR